MTIRSRLLPYAGMSQIRSKGSKSAFALISARSTDTPSEMNISYNRYFLGMQLFAGDKSAVMIRQYAYNDLYCFLQH